jgi:hypothetical protein
MRVAMLADTDKQEWNEEDLTGEILRLNDTILALVLGLMTGLLVFVATNWLVIKGGDPIGPHLALLSQFFPGYSVSFLGSLVGLAYGAVLGAVAGWSIAAVYNRLAFRKR